MSRASRARPIAAAAAFGTGCAGAAFVAVAAVVYSQTKLARRRIKPAETEPPAADGIWSAPDVDPSATRIKLAVLGDSSAAGYGLTDAAATPAAVLARGLSQWGRRPVDVVCVAVVGARSADLPAQAQRVLPGRPDVAYVMIGTNDVTHRVRPSAAVRDLAAGVALLHEAGCEVVVGTCPDLGTIAPIAQPLRSIARRKSRTLAAAQTIAVVEAGGRTVSLGDVLGPRFARERDLFADDAFHPSERGYAAAIEVSLPSVAAALGLHTDTEAAGPFLSRRARPIARAAAHAVTHPGTEVAGARVSGQEHGDRGRWARLLRRATSPTAIGADASPATYLRQNRAAPLSLRHRRARDSRRSAAP